MRLGRDKQGQVDEYLLCDHEHAHVSFPHFFYQLVDLLARQWRLDDYFGVLVIARYSDRYLFLSNCYVQDSLERNCENNREAFIFKNPPYYSLKNG